MSGDYQNTKEDQCDKATERESIARQESIDYHKDNWITAVTKSPQNSHGTFDDVTEYHWSGFSHTEKTRPATSVDVFVDQLDNNDFMQRAAQILIDLHQTGSRGEVDELFDDMAADYADYQYEKNIKE